MTTTRRADVPRDPWSLLLNVRVSPVIEARGLLLVTPAAAVRVAASARQGGDPGIAET
jgi:hypothetical protein